MVCALVTSLCKPTGSTGPNVNGISAAFEDSPGLQPHPYERLRETESTLVIKKNNVPIKTER